MTTIAEDGSHLDGASGMEAYQLKLHDNMGTSSHLQNPLAGRWRRIVQDYTHRALTKGFDKLPAISGLAQKVHQETGEEYAAGLWKENLHNDLFWWTTDDFKSADSYRAPSWTWATFDGDFTYEAVFDMNTIFYTSTMRDVKIDCTPSTVHRVGQVEAGRITLSGRLKTAIYSTESGSQDMLGNEAYS